MSSFDFNGAEPQRAMGSLIPEGTICLLVATLRPGQAGPGGWLKPSQTGCLMADFEFTVDGGDFDRRKLWSLFVTEGINEGHEKAASITRSRLRAMLESAHGILPIDNSAAAMEKRQVSGWQGFDGLRFCAKIGIETGSLKDKTAGPNSERYADKNSIKAIITPDEDHYIAPGPQAPRSTGAAGPVSSQAAVKTAAGGKPSWSV